MSVLSKLIRKTCRQWTCYELGHTWTPYCFLAWSEVGFCAFKEGFKLYLPLYIVAAVVRGKGFDYYLKYLLPEAMRSATFLGTNGFLFLCAFCVWRWLLEEDYFFMMFAASVVGGLGAIGLERKFRRGLLAVYMANIAVETLYLMLKARGMVRPLPYGEVWLFSAAAATLMYLFRRDLLHGSTHSALRFLALGSSRRTRDDSKAVEGQTSASDADTAPAVEEVEGPAAARAVTGSTRHRVASFLRLRERLVKYLDSLKRDAGRHSLCRHDNSCVYHALGGGVRFFSYGYMLQVVLRLFRLLRLLPRNPLLFLKSLLLHRGSLSFGTFLGCLVLLLRGVRCGLTHWLQQDAPWQTALAGFVSGWSMIFFRSSSIAMYVTSKAAELLYMRGIDAGYLPSIRHGDILLYSVAVGFVFHACIFEPHNVRPAYYAFLKRVCGNRFQEMNRRLLDEFGTGASTLDPYFWPNYDARFTRLAEGPHMIAELTRQARMGVS